MEGKSGEPVKVKGFFFKQSTYGNDWNSRYYVIDTKKSTLTYYKNVEEGKGKGKGKGKGRGAPTDSWKLKGQLDLRGASFANQQEQKQKRGVSIVNDVKDDVVGSECEKGKGKDVHGDVIQSRTRTVARSKCSEWLTRWSYAGLFASFMFDTAVGGLFLYQGIAQKLIAGCALGALLILQALLLFSACLYRKSRGIWITCLLATAYLTVLSLLISLAVGIALGTSSMSDLPDWSWAVFALVS
jgi:hypothetical protein